MSQSSFKNEILKAIEVVIEKSSGRRLSVELLQDLSKELHLLSKHFRVNETEALIATAIFNSYYQEGPVSVKILCDFFQCTPINLIEYHNSFLELEKRGIIIRQKTRYKRNSAFGNIEYSIHDLVIQAIIDSTPIPDIKTDHFDDPIDFLEAIYKLAEERDEENISTADLIRETKELLELNKGMGLLKSIHRLELNPIDNYIFLFILWKYLIGDELVNVSKCFDEIFDLNTQKIRVVQKLYSGESDLIRKNLVELQEAKFFDDTNIKLTEASLNILRAEGIHPHPTGKSKKENATYPNQIPYKKLFYNEAQQKELKTLGDILSGDNFKQMQKRLLDKSLQTGVAVLFHGRPGTGKTESVYQLARATGREIIKVDISKTKSMWFGESEKIIKKVFNDYKAYAKCTSICPILLFNEADAILSVRKEIGHSNVDQTENTIQNIILDELENFQGILFATTNLAANLDKAFERRFLFKIEFEKPDIHNLASIWQHKLPYLNKGDCYELANRYSFSGGQVENVVRKAEIQHVLYGRYPNTSLLKCLCDNEFLESRKTSEIGFKLNR
jgi:hypothetical protein